MDVDLGNTDPTGSTTANATTTNATTADATERVPPGVLCDVNGLLDEAGSPPAGIRWKMTEAGRQLDANLVRLRPEQVVGEHTEPDLDVLIIVLAGAARVITASGPLPVEAGALVWLPRGSTRSLVASTRGLSYLTVHRRRAGMQIGVRP